MLVVLSTHKVESLLAALHTLKDTLTTSYQRSQVSTYRVTYYQWNLPSPWPIRTQLPLDQNEIVPYNPQQA